jgi:cell division protein ZapA (FtsZ GTPase activity inhibitor)
MTTARTAAAWAAMRAIFEGAAPDFAQLAAISGRQADTIRHRAARQGWRALGDSADGLSRAERIVRLANRLIGEMEKIQEDGKGGVYDKARIETVAALMRALEKAGEIVGAEAGMQEQQKKTDADKADILRRIDERIVELARFFADEIVAGRADSGRGSAG